MLEGSADLRNLAVLTPDHLRDVRYNANHFPGAPGVEGTSGGANCQQYAYAFLRHFGYVIPDFRSSELWADSLYTRISRIATAFDLVLVHNQSESYGAHVGVCVGDGLVLHLSRQIDAPAVEALSDMRSREQYHYLIGFKTVLTRT